ncbi:hypothetical protein GTN31_07145 [Macrococcoides canis]|uniref:hypothetical protein n=1 Tax=Macrococcoides canis TaxID=1855823 RepID=UPI0013E9999C|nr:hypothetical protein GTN31_07145 [Macrococcus canis]
MDIFHNQTDIIKTIIFANTEVYNFEVEDYHTYFVGNVCVLVHNDCTGCIQMRR